MIDINIPFTAELDKIPSEDGTVEHLVPDVAGFLHSIDTFKEPPHPVMLAQSLETEGLLHEHSLIRQEYAV